MLRKLKEQDFDRYVGFAYELALDQTRSGYPTYADGIKSKNDFIARAREAFSRDGEEILLFERNSKVSGWIHYYYLQEDCYLDTCAFCVADGMNEALAEFINFARERFSGSELYLGFSKENIEAVAALESYGFECIEESYNDVVDFDHYILQPEDKHVVPITQANYKFFSDIHSQHDKDMYWNSERIFTAIDHWRIYAYLLEGKSKGVIYFKDDEFVSEIFGIDFKDDVYDSKLYRALLTAALNDCKRRGTRHMVFFNERKSQSDAIDCGFRCVGEYVCYKITL